MKTFTVPRFIGLAALLVAFSGMTVSITAPSSALSSSSPRSSSNATAKPFVSQGLITAGPSRHECLEPNFDDTGVAALQTAINKFDSETHTSVSCVSAYLNGAPTWTAWEHPWVDSSQYGYTSWVAKSPANRQLILAINLIPDSLENVDDPLGWEQSCAAGDFNSYASVLGASLVTAGLQNSVIRLGLEMNGIWENDYVGTTILEQHLWATCFSNEVTALRGVTGENFLIDWNPNACVENIPFANFYPGNAYVDVVGLDLFDVGCESPKTALTFKQLANEPLGLARFEAFASAHSKPMSLPEWGLMPIPSGDNPGYIDGIGSAFARRDFAFETYFDANLKIRPYLALGPRTPLSLAAFRKWFAKS